MYYLRKEPYEITIPEIKKIDGTIIPERKLMSDDRAIYKSRSCSRFYRQSFVGMSTNPNGMKLYTCKRLRTILALRKSTFESCGEWFDVYDENGKVELEK